MSVREVETDVLIVGGGCGGVAAALAVLSAGLRCVITEPTVMLGGQLSSQGVPPDENAWIEGRGPGADGFRGCNASYTGFRDRVRSWYRARGALTDAAMADPVLNPGGGWVSRLCFEPRLADEVIREMLAEADAGRGLLSVWCGCEPVAVEVEGDRVGGVRFRGSDGEVVVAAGYVLEATEMGDVLALGGVEHAIGAEAASVYDELHGRTDLEGGRLLGELDQQACTWCFAVEHHAGEDFVESEPEGYGEWAAYVPEMTPGWTGRLFSWTVPSHNEAARIDLGLVPPPGEPEEGRLELWRYRRVVDGSAHTDGRADVSLFNVVQMDYWRAPLLGVSASEREAALAGARRQAACFLHWMRTEAPRDDGGVGFPGLKLSGAALGSEDGFALAPYIREPRRLLARTMLTEAHVGAEQRRAFARDDLGVVAGEAFVDSVAIGHYPIDLHPSCAGRNSVYVEACPFRVPMGALVPRRVRNVISAGKAMGVSHVANGSTRLHPVEWAVGEAAGVIAASCVLGGVEPHEILDRAERVALIQERLRRRGVPLAWPWEGST